MNCAQWKNRVYCLISVLKQFKTFYGENNVQIMYNQERTHKNDQPSEKPIVIQNNSGDLLCPVHDRIPP